MWPFCCRDSNLPVVQQAPDDATLRLQVLGEDLVLVSGQQERLQRGGDTWANPVSYDKLAVRYRRWRNGLIGFSGSGSPHVDGAVRMSAGQLFQEEESDMED